MEYSIILDVGIGDNNPQFYANEDSLINTVNFFIESGYEVKIRAYESVDE